MRGTMLWFNEVKDHGFIRTEEGERLSVRGLAFANCARPVGRCAEAPVSFEIDGISGTRQAENVVFEVVVAPRRARIRSRGLRT
jgi:hypothetical protein